MPQETQGIDSKSFARDLAGNLAQKHGPQVGGVTAGGTSEARPAGSGPDNQAGQQEAPPPARSIEEPQATEEAQTPDGQTQTPEPQPEQAEQTQVEQAQETVEDAQQQLQDTGTIDRETYVELRTLGIELPDPDSVPQELMPAYQSLVDSAVQEHERATQAQRNAEQLQMEVQDFARRLQENPEDFLLTMAMNNQEVFDRVQQQLERAEHDEDYRELLQRELNLKAREAQAERQQRAAREAQIQQAATQIRSRTRQQAQRAGVDPEIAEQVVAARITQNGGDISAQEIDSVVRSLAPQGALAGAQKTRQTAKSPTQQQKEQTAPAGSRGDKGQPASSGDTGRQQTKSTPARQGIRGIIGRASERASRALGET